MSPDFSKFFERVRDDKKDVCENIPEEEISELESLELHDAKKEDAIEKNLTCEEIIDNKVEETLEILDRHIDKKSRLGYFGKFPSFFYNEKELPVIRDGFINFNQAVLSAAEKPDVKILGHSNLVHILRNGPYGMIQLAEKAANRTQKTQDETKFSSAENIAKISKNKKVWDGFLYYIELISRPDKIALLEDELTFEEGYLNRYKDLYLKGEVVSHSLSRISHFNFFTRLEAREDKMILRGIRKADDFVKPIMTKQEFNEVFDRLEEKESLDKEKIRQRFFLNGNKI